MSDKSITICEQVFKSEQRSALLAKSGACKRLQPAQSSVSSQGVSAGNYNDVKYTSFQGSVKGLKWGFAKQILPSLDRFL